MLRRTPQRYWTDAETAELIRLYNLGTSPRDIAPKLDRTISSVENKLRDRKLYSDGIVSVEAPDRIDSNDRAHLGRLYQANGYGFAWWPDEIMARVYALEWVPAKPRPMWGLA